MTSVKDSPGCFTDLSSLWDSSEIVMVTLAIRTNSARARSDVNVGEGLKPLYGQMRASFSARRAGNQGNAGLILYEIQCAPRPLGRGENMGIGLKQTQRVSMRAAPTRARRRRCASGVCRASRVSIRA